MLARLFNKSTEYTELAGKSVKIPKLTPAKYKALLEHAGTLPAIVAIIASSWGSGNAIATLITGLERGLDEIIELVAVLAEVDAELLYEGADLNEISEFIRVTLEKNDLQRTLKNFQAVLGHFRTNPTGGGSRA